MYHSRDINIIYMTDIKGKIYRENETRDFEF